MPKPKVLHLTLEREWFDQIAKGLKRHEYREYKPYWKGGWKDGHSISFCFAMATQPTRRRCLLNIEACGATENVAVM